jgi:ABC-type sulfate/molybdate transport systems ATPase subunit
VEQRLPAQRRAPALTSTRLFLSHDRSPGEPHEHRHPQPEQALRRHGRLRRHRPDIPAGELVALLGPSGSGKTTLLRIIAGLEVPDSGQMLFHGERRDARCVRERNVGFVFQHYALFKHMSVFENVAFGLRVRPRSATAGKGGDPRRVHGSC